MSTALNGEPIIPLLNHIHPRAKYRLSFSPHDLEIYRKRRPLQAALQARTWFSAEKQQCFTP
jgi:hypothetical protein